MKLPLLKIDPTSDRDVSSCQGKDFCKDCSLYEGNGGRCHGCTPRVKALLDGTFKACYTTCSSCTGYRTEVAAICCRSPMKDIYLKAVTKSDNYNDLPYVFTKRPRLTFKRHAVLNWIYGSPGKLDAEAPHLFPDHDVICTSLSFVKGKKAHFYSANIKNHLKIKPSTKLILTTQSIDDHLERAWDLGQYGGDFYTDVGIDYWTNLGFSFYDREANMHAYYQYARALYSQEQGKGWFVQGYMPSQRFKLDDVLDRWLEACPQVMFNSQFAITEDNLKSSMAGAVWWHKVCKPDVAFWYVGATTPEFMASIRKVVPNREIYWVSGKPIYNATNGKYLRRDGGEKKASLDTPKKEILYHNVEVFENMVQNYGG